MFLKSTTAKVLLGARFTLASVALMQFSLLGPLA
jgi:hypothetical protein